MNEKTSLSTATQESEADVSRQGKTASVETPQGQTLAPRYGSKDSKAIMTKADMPQWFSSVQFNTRPQRLELMRLEGKREADHDKFKGMGQVIKHLIRIPYEFVDEGKGEEITVPRYLCQTAEGLWLNVFSQGMVREIDKLVSTFGIPPWEKPFRFICVEIDVHKPSPFLSLRFEDA